MSKYYFSDNDEEMCYTISAHKQQMRDNEETERTVFEAIKSSENGFFYCKAFDSVGANESEGGEPCGRACDKYKPRNGKSGCCKSLRKLYTSSDISKIITL